MESNDCIVNIYVRLLTRADKDLKQPLQSPTVGKENKEDIKALTHALKTKVNLIALPIDAKGLSTSLPASGSHLKHSTRLTTCFQTG